MTFICPFLSSSPPPPPPPLPPLPPGLSCEDLVGHSVTELAEPMGSPAEQWPNQGQLEAAIKKKCDVVVGPFVIKGGTEDSTLCLSFR